MSISIPDSFKKTSNEQIILTESAAILTQVEMQQIYPDNASTLAIIPSESLKKTVENTEKPESIPTAVPANEHTDLYSKSPVKTEPNSSVTTTPPVKLAQQPNIVKTAFLGLLAFSGSVFLSQNYLDFYGQYPIAITNQPYQDTSSLDLYQKNSTWLGIASTTASETSIQNLFTLPTNLTHTCPFTSLQKKFTNELGKFTTHQLIQFHVVITALFIAGIRVFILFTQALSEEFSEIKKLIHFRNKINYRLATLRESRA